MKLVLAYAVNGIQFFKKVDPNKGIRA